MFSPLKQEITAMRLGFLQRNVSGGICIDRLVEDSAQGMMGQ